MLPHSRTAGVRSLRVHAHAELIARADYLSVCDRDVEQLLTLHGAPGLVFQRRDELLAGHVEHLARRGIRDPPVHTEAQPTYAIPSFDTVQLFWRHYGRIEHVDGAVGAIGHPQFLFIRGERDAMARAAMPLHCALLVSL